MVIEAVAIPLIIAVIILQFHIVYKLGGIDTRLRRLEKANGIADSEDQL